MASPPRPAARGLWSVSEVPQDENWKKPPKKSKAFYDVPLVAIGPSNQREPKNSDTLDTRSKNKGKEIVKDDSSSEPEDWGTDPVSEQSPANEYETVKPEESDDDDGNWGSLQGGASDNWGVPVDLFSGTADNLDEVELHTWEGDTSVRSARDPPNATASELTQKFLKSLKCPTHNYHCNKNICKDMARFVKEEEAKRRKGVTDSDRKGTNATFV